MWLGLEFFKDLFKNILSRSFSFFKKSGEQSDLHKVALSHEHTGFELGILRHTRLLPGVIVSCYGTRCRDIYFLYERNITLARCFLACFSPRFEFSLARSHGIASVHVSRHSFVREFILIAGITNQEEKSGKLTRNKKVESTNYTSKESVKWHW